MRDEPHGIKADRSRIRSAALKVIRIIEAVPKSGNRDARRDWLAPPPLSAFRRLEPIGFGLNDDDNEWFFAPEDCTPDLVWPLDVGVVVEEAGEDKTLQFSRTRTVTMKEVRGYASRFSPFMVRTDHAVTYGDILQTAAGLCSWIGGRWVDAQCRTLYVNGSIPDKTSTLTVSDADSINVEIAIALRQRYEWSVSLALGNSPSIRFATDPTGIKDVFRVRDLPEGRDRREALLTWVGDHWRQNRRDPDIEIYVRKHLRGATQFNWRDMNVELVPSQYDIEKRDALIAERAAMKAAGEDRRIRRP